MTRTCLRCGAVIDGPHLVASFALAVLPRAYVCSVACADLVPRDDATRTGGRIVAWLAVGGGRTLPDVARDDDTIRVLTIRCDGCQGPVTHAPEDDPPPPWRRFDIFGVVGTFHACCDTHEAAVRRRYERPEGGGEA